VAFCGIQKLARALDTYGARVTSSLGVRPKRTEVGDRRILASEECV
jgi:hypothetical protein